MQKMSFFNVTLQGGKVCAEIAMFGHNSTHEYHAIFHITDTYLPYLEQVEFLHKALQEVKAYLNNPFTVFMRYFLSDAANQKELLDLRHADLQWQVNYSVIQQPPLDGSKVVVWAYFASDLELDDENEDLCVTHNGYKHYWRSSKELTSGTSFEQAEHLLQEEDKFLARHGLTMFDNCIRTWFYLQNIDVNYQGMVDARNKNFSENGLTKDTHFIASTGIGGRMGSRESIVHLDSYSVEGLKPEQIKFLYAKTHLNPTYEYNVAFERGVQVIYGDRKHLLISGTASIDNKGQIVHPGDIRMQVHRMLENVQALLNEGGGNLNDLAQIFIYLRDVADYATVRDIFAEQLPQTPKVILLAPVCRPGWLIEMEGIAIVDHSDKNFKNF